MLINGMCELDLLQDIQLSYETLGQSLQNISIRSGRPGTSSQHPAVSMGTTQSTEGPNRMKWRPSFGCMPWPFWLTAKTRSGILCFPGVSGISGLQTGTNLHGWPSALWPYTYTAHLPGSPACKQLILGLLSSCIPASQYSITNVSLDLFPGEL